MISLRAYKNGDGGVYIMDGEGNYPELKCKFDQEKNCSSGCKNFMINSWEIGEPVLCGGLQLGVLG